MKASTILMTLWFMAVVLLSLSSSGFCQSDEYAYLHVKHIRDITDDFNRPTEVAVSASGRVFVLDGANNRVVVFTEKGEKIFSFGRPGTGKGEFQQPVGMAVDVRENIYIADTGNRRMQVFDSMGKYIRLIDLAQMQARPVEVAVSPQSGKLYVSDSQHHQIHCFGRDGSFEFSWGGYGKMIGEFMYPGMIDIDTSGNLYVVDVLNGRVQIFDDLGGNPQQLGVFGITPGSLFRPKGVVVNKHSLAYVSDSYTGVIQLFDNSGKLVGIVSEDSATPLRLTTPLGMAIDDEARQLYVVQTELNKISVFEFQDDK